MTTQMLDICLFNTLTISVSPQRWVRHRTDAARERKTGAMQASPERKRFAETQPGGPVGSEPRAKRAVRKASLRKRLSQPGSEGVSRASWECVSV
jgi:hypothetical protein